MKRNFLLLMLGLILWPMAIEATQFKSKKTTPIVTPIKSPDASIVNVDLDEITGVLTICYLGNAGSMEVTISQNGVPIENDVIAVSNGQTVIYNLAGYAFGDYLLTIETADGAITQYILSVIDD